MKTVVIVSPYFLPSYLVGTHRARLWSYHLPEFGWRPVILTSDPRTYECKVDWDLLDLLPTGLEVIHTKALPVKPVRLVGDMALRSFYWYRRELFRLARAGRMDFLLITVLPGYAALLGSLVYRHFGVPYGIDYQDPWVYEFAREDPVWTKAGLTQVLARQLEPLAVKQARLITGINEAYYASVLRRNPHLYEQAVTAGMPLGGSENDFAALKKKPRPTFLFDPADGKRHILYAGALLPKAHAVLERFFAALVLLRERRPAWTAQLRFHFVGTGQYEGDVTRGHAVRPYIEKYGLQDLADEMPSRVSYLDSLNHLQASTAILVIGSTEIHYSPSKIYQGIMAGRPVFALLHERSSALATMLGSGAGEVFTFNEQALPDPARLAAALEHFLDEFPYDPARVNWEKFSAFSARESTRVLASALDRAYEREQQARAERRLPQ